MIDDSDMMRLYLRRCLEKGGFEVEDWVPLSAMEVSDKLNAVKPDLILTDLQMPGCNGVSVARMAARTHPQVPILVLTAFGDENLASSLEKFGVQKVLSKPIDAARLISSIEAALKGVLSAL